MPPPIRVALRIADGPVPAFVAAAARSIQAEAGVDVVLLISGSRPTPPSSRRSQTILAVERAYDRLERRILPGGPSALATDRSWRPPEGVPTSGDGRESSAGVADPAFDVLIDLTFDEDGVPPGLPGSETWRLRFAEAHGGAPCGTVERPASDFGLATSMLLIRANGGVLETEVGISTVHRYGFARDRDAVYWRSSLLPARRLARMVAGQVDREPRSARAETVRPDELTPSRSAPRTGMRLPPFGGLLSAVGRKALERALFVSTWVVLTRSRGSNDALPTDLSGFQPVATPPGRFYADPFVQGGGSGPRLYVEDCPVGEHRGRISALTLDSARGWAFDRVILDDVEHRAYPHVVSTPDGLVMTPDSGRQGGVDLFEAAGPDGPFERIGRCLEGLGASDPTLLWHEGRYWLFVTVTGHGMSPWDELHLFHSASLDGVWHPHPRNPIVADVRRARPAGRIFLSGGTLIRPGQDCSEAYGRRIVLSAITSLTPIDYEEHPIGAIEPTGAPDSLRTHTYTFDGTIEALDAYRRVPRWDRRSVDR